MKNNRKTMSFAKKREEAHMTMEQAAKAFGVTSSAICQWEKGLTMPSTNKLAKIASTYGCTIDDLLKEDAE